MCGVRVHAHVQLLLETVFCFRCIVHNVQCQLSSHGNFASSCPVCCGRSYTQPVVCNRTLEMTGSINEDLLDMLHGEMLRSLHQAPVAQHQTFHIWLRLLFRLILHSTVFMSMLISIFKCDYLFFRGATPSPAAPQPFHSPSPSYASQTTAPAPSSYPSSVFPFFSQFTSFRTLKFCSSISVISKNTCMRCKLYLHD